MIEKYKTYVMNKYPFIDEIAMSVSIDSQMIVYLNSFPYFSSQKLEFACDIDRITQYYNIEVEQYYFMWDKKDHSKTIYRSTHLRYFR